jgi:hypothetical protein
MFRSPFHDHHQGSSFVPSAFTTFQLPASSFVFFGVCGRMPSTCMCVRCSCLCVVWSLYRPKQIRAGEYEVGRKIALERVNNITSLYHYIYIYIYVFYLVVIIEHFFSVYSPVCAIYRGLT